MRKPEKQKTSMETKTHQVLDLILVREASMCPTKGTTQTGPKSPKGVKTLGEREIGEGAPDETSM